MAARIFYGVVTWLFGGLFLPAAAIVSLSLPLDSPAYVLAFDPIMNLQLSPVTFWGGGFIVGGAIALFLRSSRGHSVWAAVWRSWVLQTLFLFAYSGIGTTWRAHNYDRLTGQPLLILATVALAIPTALLVVACRRFFRPSQHQPTGTTP